jgi:hypothetical protein
MDLHFDACLYAAVHALSLFQISRNLYDSFVAFFSPSESRGP